MHSERASTRCCTARSLRAWNEFPQEDPLRVVWVRGPVPARAMAVSSLWHVAAIFIMMLPIWGAIHWNQPHPIVSDFHITYDLPLPELPPVSPPASAHSAAPAAKPSPPGKPNEPLPPEGADAFNPRQTILSQPQRVTHPRQTLIQPDASAGAAESCAAASEYRRVGQNDSSDDAETANFSFRSCADSQESPSRSSGRAGHSTRYAAA